MEDIVDIAVEAGGFKTFVSAVKAVGLVELLKVKGHSPFLCQMMVLLHCFPQAQSMIY